MSITLSQVQPSNFLAPANPLVLLNVDHRFEYLRVTNNSPYQLSINLTGTPITLSEFTVKDVEVPDYWQGMLTVTPTVNISTASHAQSNLLTIEGYYKGEIDSPISQQIPQQAVTATASGKPIFTAHFGVGSSAQAVQTLNVFNPPNSGVNMTFHSAKVFTNSPGVPQAVLTYIAGADLNLATAVSIGSHTASSTPPSSFAHATFDDAAVGHGGTVIDNTRLPGSTSNGTVDLLAFPDTVTLFPGTNLLVVCSDTTSGHVIELILKWSEDIAVPSFGGVPTGVATSIINEGNPLQNILQATKSGDAAEDITITNAGTITTNGVIIANAGVNTNIVRDDITGNGVISVTGGAGAQNTRLQADTEIRFQVPQGTDRLTVTSTQVALANAVTLALLIGSVSRISIFTGSATNAGVLQAHGLGVKPDFVMFQETGAAGDSNTFVWDIVASDATNVKVWTGNATARNYIALALKQ